jgi:mitochondrial fission protein ELM1
MSTALVSASASAAAAAAPQVGAGPKSEGPSEKVLAHACKIAMEQDKPILLDYYKHTQVGGHAFLGEDKDTKEKILVKNTDEYTSPVTKMFKAKEDYIIVTENSVYIVSGSIKKKEISTGGRA